MAILSFGDQMTADIANGVNSKQSRKFPSQWTKKAAARLDALASAQTLNDLTTAGIAVEPLKYTKPGYYSLKINDQYRVFFKFEDGNASDVYIEGYDHTGRK